MNRPEWANEYPELTDMINSWGYEVVASKAFGTYQGDMVAILKDENRTGIVVIGYGSCTACDALQAAYLQGENSDDWQDLIDLAEQTKRNIVWRPTPEELLAMWATDDVPQWYSYETGVNEFVCGQLGKLIDEDSY